MVNLLTLGLVFAVLLTLLGLGVRFVSIRSSSVVPLTVVSLGLSLSAGSFARLLRIIISHLLQERCVLPRGD